MKVAKFLDEPIKILGIEIDYIAVLSVGFVLFFILFGIVPAVVVLVGGYIAIRAFTAGKPQGYVNYLFYRYTGHLPWLLPGGFGLVPLSQRYTPFEGDCGKIYFGKVLDDEV